MISMPKGSTPNAALQAQKLTARAIRERGRAGLPIAMVTAYDFTMARLLDEAGVDILLVGDSLGMTIQGRTNTLGVTIEEICYHGRAVARAATRAHVVGDMPFMSYETSPEKAVESAGRLVKEGDFESVKLEGGLDVAEHIRRIARAGIPVMAHVGLTPQRVLALGGFRVQGRGHADADRIVADARAVEEAGAYAVVLEAVPPDVAARVTESVGIPTIGIGAGSACGGQVLVCTDLLGMSRGRVPRFVRQFAELGDAIVRAAEQFVAEVRSRAFPTAEQSYRPNESPEPKAAEGLDHATLATAGDESHRA
jgi:3-methyl-2-oxobutanoate hydroxymethyltransferase